MSHQTLSAYNQHSTDKKLHNNHEKLHNSSDTSTDADQDVDPSSTRCDEQDDSFDDEFDEEDTSGYGIDTGESCVWYYTDDDGTVKSHEYSYQELAESEPDEGYLNEHEPVLDIVNVVTDEEDDSKQEVSIPAPKPGERPLDMRVHVSTVRTPTIGKHKHPVKRETAKPRSRDTAKRPSTTVGKMSDLEDKGPKCYFSLTELDHYITHRSRGLAKKSMDWITRSSDALWESTRGEISHKTMTALRDTILDKYRSAYSHYKVLSFASGFLKFLSQTKMDSSYMSFAIYLERPRATMVRKAITSRIITRDAITDILQRIGDAEAQRKLGAAKARNYRAFTLLAAYSGLRPSTMERLTIDQMRDALKQEKPVIEVRAEQEKNRVEHYVPVHPDVAAAIHDVLLTDYTYADGAQPFFQYNSFERWLERQKVPLPRVRDPTKAHMWVGDFRKFAEQFGDIIGWESTNRKYVLAHGMTGVDWSHYKHPLPENVYSTYMTYWADVHLAE
ncbi:MAG: hypothetical protein ACXVI1_10900 [Halobacteriota archaeon]